MRNKLLQLVHIGKTQLGMDDETYRSLLSQQFYQNSAKNISYSDLIKLVKLLQTKGAKIQLPRSKSSLSPIQRKLWAVWKQMHADSVIDDGSSHGLNSFVKRSLNGDVQWNELTNSQATLILENLKQWQKRVGK
ncbi:MULTISPECIES: regulatory protein GemA [Actinobacillus]|uniref:regulatory protein GemA n=1 Tax=Actinobacillus TaxID=713 RepID=UPI0012409EAB|nr:MULTISPECIES: regulatory protein GemA [Actinobacillus]MDG4948441.1 regulatory protein GemA [Actinobacillus equuli subsp. haemolyticus]WGE65612.1 regulatory protein GemA [Actinobacillus equuli subsp. equuli]WGE83687.1 regulatory protein GemA [Actinobacillus equuli subsp. equuli]